jgi:hypothetical protein
MKQETKQILCRVIELQRELDIRKALYDELDMLTIQLQAEGFKDAELSGLVISLVDNFEKTNTAFRPAGVKRFELKVKKVKSV